MRGLGVMDPAAKMRVLWALCPALLWAMSCPGQKSAAHEAVSKPAPAWLQWGGPTRDFKVGPVALASSWPKAGPKRLWQRPLGEGYSAIVANGERIFTMYRDGKEEVLIAMRATDGKTLWEDRDAAPQDPKQTDMHGPGPHATPLVMGSKVFAIGFTGRLRCVNESDGQRLWSVDLMKDLGARPHYYGYSSSPIVYRDSLIVLVGGSICGVAALDPKDGSVRWKSAPSKTSYASPILINVDGQDQLVFYTETEVVGMNPLDGTKPWGHKAVNFCRTNCTAPLWGEDNLLFAATKGAGGTRVLRLRQQDGKTRVEEVWRDRRMRMYFWNALRIGDYVYTSTRDTGAFYSVIDVKTGKYVMQERGLGATNGIYADGKLILLNDSGTLLLARPKPDGIEFLSRVALFDGLSWTVPTLVGKTLYVRNRKHIMALELE
jgi:outer membrane protein assembly factor BamB